MALLNSSSIKEFLYDPKKKESESAHKLKEKCINIGNEPLSNPYTTLNTKNKQSKIIIY